MSGSYLEPLELSEDERTTLERWARRPKSAQALALRCRIVLACADGKTNTVVAHELGIERKTAGKWRARFVAERLDGLQDEPRPGAPRTIDDDAVEAVVVKTLEETPLDATHWSTRVDGQGHGYEPVGGLSHLASVWIEASFGRDLQTLARSPLRRKGA